MNIHNILIIYYNRSFKVRKTILDSLYCFKRYSSHNCFYLNAFTGIPFYIKNIEFDLVIYHYTFTAMKWNRKEFSKVLDNCSELKKVRGHKIAIPQDEYVNSDIINKFFLEFGIKTVFTCLPLSECSKVYPRSECEVDNFHHVLTGYIDDLSLEKSKLDKPPRHKDRKFDVGYRARNVPFWLGSHGLKKSEISSRFKKFLINKKARISISNDPKDVLLGNAWERFLRDCRVVLGCEGGASLHDKDGSIREKVEDFVSKFPKASFSEVEQNCFPGEDGNLRLFAISPRHFESCLTKTCQVLYEGSYDNIFKANHHFIEIKKDWSNIPEILKKIEDIEYCEKIAENAYHDIVLCQKYMYSKYVKYICSVVTMNHDYNNIKVRKYVRNIFSIHIKLLNTLMPLKTFYQNLKIVLYKLLKKHTPLLLNFKRSI